MNWLKERKNEMDGENVKIDREVKKELKDSFKKRIKQKNNYEIFRRSGE